MSRGRETTWKILIAGSGGQGVLTLSKLLAYTATYAKFNVSFLPSYGAEMRGGYVYTMLSFSYAALTSPVISIATYGLFMNQASVQFMLEKVDENGWCIWNSSLIQSLHHRKNQSIGIPATEIAEELGELRTANMVMAGGIGRLLKNNGFPITLSSLETGLSNLIHSPKSMKINLTAISKGWNITEQILQNE